MRGLTHAAQRTQDHPVGSGPTRLPETRVLLAWLYAGRLAIAAALFLGAAVVWRNVPPATSLAVTLLVIAAGIFTAGSFWYTHLSAGWPGLKFRYSQVIFDVFLVTVVVYLTGGTQSNFAALYILVICAGAILLPMLGGILIGLLVSVLYGASAAWDGNARIDGGLLLQIALFALVALVTGYVGDRLRQTGTELGEARTELRQLRSDTDEILGTINSGILTVDGEGHLIYMNQAAQNLLQMPALEWLGRRVVPDLERLAPGLGAVIARSVETRGAIQRSETRPGENFPFVLGVSTTVLDRAAPALPSITAIFQDITERKRAEALQRRAERLEAVAELSTSLAHEIKNPLASIRSATEQLASDGVEPADQQILKRLVVRESDRLTRLLREFLDFARVQVLAPDALDIAALVQEAVAVLRAHPDAEGKTIRMIVPNGNGAHPFVRGDADLLHRAVLNLGLNAIQWAGIDGHIEIDLDTIVSDLLAPTRGTTNIARLRVSDTGPGVPTREAERIFDPFYTLRPGGTGLGLALVQRAAEAHGGIVFLANPAAPEWGTTFTLYLPLEDSHS
ncbi:MAG: PAS domain-containing protein [Gemmatimonadetes bacterium]|nr:PAS domain-containing protein [Gemmatimonadota bacterium]